LSGRGPPAQRPEERAQTGIAPLERGKEEELEMKTGAEEMVEPTRKGSETGPDIGAGALHRVPVASQDDEGGRAATEEPTRIVVYVIDGTIQCVLATKEVETYVVEHDLRNDHGKHGFNTEICGLPVMLSRRRGAPHRTRGMQ